MWDPPASSWCWGWVSGGSCPRWSCGCNDLSGRRRPPPSTGSGCRTPSYPGQAAEGQRRSERRRHVWRDVDDALSRRKKPFNFIWRRKMRVCACVSAPPQILGCPWLPASSAELLQRIEFANINIFEQYLCLWSWKFPNYWCTSAFSACTRNCISDSKSEGSPAITVGKGQHSSWTNRGCRGCRPARSWCHHEWLFFQRRFQSCGNQK